MMVGDLRLGAHPMAAFWNIKWDPIIERAKTDAPFGESTSKRPPTNQSTHSWIAAFDSPPAHQYEYTTVSVSTLHSRGNIFPLLEVGIAPALAHDTRHSYQRSTMTAAQEGQLLLDRLESVSLSPHALALCRMEYLEPSKTSSGDDDDATNGGLAQVLALLLQQAVAQWETTASSESDDTHLLQIMQILQNITQTDATLAEESACCTGSQDCYATILHHSTSTLVDDLAQALLADAASHDHRARPFSTTDLESRLPRLWVVPQMSTSTHLELLVHPVTTGQTEQHDVGFVMWPSAVVLSRYIANHPELVLQHDSSILELGAGCGLVGLTAARLLQQSDARNAGQQQVIFTDYNPTVLQNIRRNVRLNNLGSFVTVTGLDFCDQLTQEQVEANSDDGVSAPGWIDMEGQQQPQVGLILAADVICYSNDATMVADTIKAALAPGGTAIVVSADENSRFGVEHFPEACYQAGLDVQITHIVADEKEASSNDEQAMLVDDLQNTTGFRQGYNLIMFTIVVE